MFFFLIIAFVESNTQQGGSYAKVLSSHQNGVKLNKKLQTTSIGFRRATMVLRKPNIHHFECFILTAADGDDPAF